MALSEVSTAIFNGSLITMGVATLLYFIALAALISRLRESHSDIYLQLGEPSVFQSTVSSSVSLVGFILKGRYNALGDRRLRLLGAICRALLLLGFVAAALSLITSH